MTEGGLIKLYIEKEHLNEAEVASAIDVPAAELETIYHSQTIAPDIKKKLQAFFGRNIFDGTLLTEYHNRVPDQQANKSKR